MRRAATGFSPLVCAFALVSACSSASTSTDDPTIPAATSTASTDPAKPTPTTAPVVESKDAGVDGPAPAGDHIQTVFVIMMENHSWSTIKGSASAAYINQTLVPMGAHAEAYKTPAGNHPSEPNYIWLEAGDNLGITNDNAPSSNHQSTKDHLTAQLETKGVSWKAYSEDAPSGVCPLTSSGLFDPKHTPQLYFDDVTDTNKSASAHCIEHVVPYSQFAADLASNEIGRYNFITPNLCNDMHGNGFSGACSVLGSDSGHIKLGDDWLAAEVPKILASSAYKNNGVIFLLWDEGDGFGSAQDGPIGAIAISPLAKKGFSTSTAFTHSSMLRTLETIFDVPFLRGAQNATSLGEMFTSFP